MFSDIVVDLGFGDGGKGVTVDNLALPDSVVVRFSGGHQAGHTVIRGGKKHIFSSYGSGTLRGARSFFTEDTCFYVPAMNRELDKLRGLGVEPDLTIHPLATAVTPFDIIYNRAREYKLRHGSCGWGIGAAMSRQTQSPYKMQAIDFLHNGFRYQKLKAIESYYQQKVIKEGLADEYVHFFHEVMERWSLDHKVNFKIGQLPEAEHYVFEGSQGILLDMDHGIFPNVTFANTTSKNALKYVKGEYSVWGVTRTYGTRHGNGWIPNSKEVKLKNNEEEINTLNKWQGDFRTFKLDLDLLRYAIAVDSVYSKDAGRRNLVVTCTDQVEDFDFGKISLPEVDYFYNNSSAKCGNLNLVW